MKRSPSKNDPLIQRRSSSVGSANIMNLDSMYNEEAYKEIIPRPTCWEDFLKNVSLIVNIMLSLAAEEKSVTKASILLRETIKIMLISSTAAFYTDTVLISSDLMHHLAVVLVYRKLKMLNLNNHTTDLLDSLKALIRVAKEHNIEINGVFASDSEIENMSNGSSYSSEYRVIKSLNFSAKSIKTLYLAIESHKGGLPNKINLTIIQHVRILVSSLGKFFVEFDNLPMETVIQLLGKNIAKKRAAIFIWITDLVAATKNGASNSVSSKFLNTIAQSIDKIGSCIAGILAKCKKYLQDQYAVNEKSFSTTLEKEMRTVFRNEKLQEKQLKINESQKMVKDLTIATDKRKSSLTNLRSPYLLSTPVLPAMFDEIIFSSSGKVSGGRLKSFIEVLIGPEIRVHGFAQQFMISYRLFASSLELFEGLKEQYLISPPQSYVSGQLEEWVRDIQRPVQFRY
jgi:hypothetical protein